MEIPAPPTRRTWPAAVALALVLIALFGWRLSTRRPDASRMPRRPDVLVLHVEGLRPDAGELGRGLGLDVLLRFPDAVAQSVDARRSALSLLAGRPVLALDADPGPDSLGPALRAGGWHTALLGDAPLVAAAGAGFEVAEIVDASGAADRLAALPADGPRAAVVHLAAAAPLHRDTTDAAELRRRYAVRSAELRGALARCVGAFAGARPLLVVVLGANGAQLGEHPDRPDAPWEEWLRVPLLVGLRGADGLPDGAQRGLVATEDVAPTIRELLDLPPGAGAGLEASMHGWAERAPRPALHVGLHEVAWRDGDWKLVVPVDAPWRLRRAEAALFTLGEDPEERVDLLAGRPPGPVATRLLDALGDALDRAQRGAP